MIVVSQYCDVTGMCSTIGAQNTLHIVVVTSYGMRDCRSATAGTDTGPASYGLLVAIAYDRRRYSGASTVDQHGQLIATA